MLEAISSSFSLFLFETVYSLILMNNKSNLVVRKKTNNAIRLFVRGYREQSAVVAWRQAHKLVFLYLLLHSLTFFDAPHPSETLWDNLNQGDNVIKVLKRKSEGGGNGKVSTSLKQMRKASSGVNKINWK